MTPQQLMDLPGYGAAEKWLRKAGKWRLTPEEKLEQAMYRIAAAISDASDAIKGADDYIDDALSEIMSLTKEQQ